MEVIHNIENISIKKPIAAIGIFDGVHLAHQKIIERLNQRAKEYAGSSVIITLWPHPKHIIKSKDHFELKLLTTLDEKINILEAFGIQYLVVLEFNMKLARLSFEDFTKQILCDKLGINHLIVGFNHQFGKNRQGNFEKLENLKGRCHFGLEQIEPFLFENEKVSSSLIRNLVKEGDVLGTAKILGRPYEITGIVGSGNRIGREIGFPTANIKIDDEHKLIPKTGVYAVNIILGNKIYKGMLNIGTRPTVDSKGQQVIEVNIFDFDENIYDQKASVKFIERIRDEIKFDNVNSLKSQLINDKETVKLVLSRNK